VFLSGLSARLLIDSCRGLGVYEIQLVPQNKGIDLNRCWQIGSTYEKFTSDRNYNGDIGFQAYEAQALRDFMLKKR
jgi:hypothetical protein